LSIHREWYEFIAVSVLKESSENPWPVIDPSVIVDYQESINNRFKAYIYKLPHPIICEDWKLFNIFDLHVDKKRIRFYPPFPINEGRETEGAFEQIQIPTGKKTIESWTAFPDTMAKNFQSQWHFNDKSSNCQGLRLDVEDGAPEEKIINIFLEQVCQFTYQWWLRSRQSPFQGMKRYTLCVDKDFNILKELCYHEAKEVATSCYPTKTSQTLLGIEKPLDKRIWDIVSSNIRNMTRADTELLAFNEAVADYMADDDERCILDLSLCVEILGNKRRILQGQRDVAADRLIRETDLVDEATRSVLKKLFIDRGHVAHGRPIHILTTDSNYTLEVYMEAVRTLVSGYLSLIQGKWKDSLALSIGKAGKKKGI
jgi:hypothetical protein